MKKTIILVIACVATTLSTFAQEENVDPVLDLQQKVEVHSEAISKLNNLKITGYLQPQFQWGEQAAALKVGTANEDATKSFNRIGVRRGRIKFVYDDGGIASGTFQLNIVDKSNASGVSQAVVQLKEAYLTVKDPWFLKSAFQAGVFDRPFGNEISYSSSLLESPERSRVINTFFPEECDLGGKFVLQAPASSSLNFIKLEGGLFAGNAINPEIDNHKDFIGHLTASKPIGSSAKWGLGVSYYNGGVYEGANTGVYTMKDKSFVNNPITNAAFAKREYYGVDGQFSVETPFGMTQLRAEYMAGTQPGTSGSSSSPNYAAIPTTSTTTYKNDPTTNIVKATATTVYNNTYIRPAMGFYAILVQDLGQSPFSLVAKYDVYDPNTSISGNEIGAKDSNTSKTDIKYSTLGLGGLWRINPNVRIQAYYEFVKNETSTNLTSHISDLKDNTLTVRFQYKF